MARLARFHNGNRWHAIRMGDWTLKELLKYVAGLAVLVLVIWNMTMLSSIAQPGHPAHMLRTERSSDTSRAPVNTATAAAAAHATSAVPTERPWFLDPKEYERESGCDFSAAVAALRPEELEIHCGNIEQLTLGEFLGQGFWREVYKATWQGRDVAVKIVKPHLLNRSDIVTRHVEEVAAIFPVRNAPNIVALRGWCNTTVVVDYVPQKLDELLYESDTPVSVRRALELALDAARGLAQLHSAAGGPFAHTDIQTRQFLVDAHGTLLLNDFNRIKYAGPRLAHATLASDDADNGDRNDRKCTFATPVAKGKWRSPEEYTHVALDERLDVYSLALVLWSLRSRVKPFDDVVRDVVYTRVPQGTRPPIAKMHDFPVAMQQLIVRAWDTTPANRPTALALATAIETILADYVAAEAATEAQDATR